MQEPIVLQPPALIEGEPHEVAELVGRDLAALAVGVSAHVSAAFVQQRAAGLSEHQTLESWETSREGEAAIEVKRRAAALVVAIRRLREV